MTFEYRIHLRKKLSSVYHLRVRSVTATDFEKAMDTFREWKKELKPGESVEVEAERLG